VLNLERTFKDITLIEQTADTVRVQVGAGVKIPKLLDFCVEHALAGLEFMSGIPATVGGALWMNAGTPEGEFGQFVESVHFVNRKGNIQSYSHDKCGFSYRHSHFPSGAILTECIVTLKCGDAQQIKEKIRHNKQHRIETQPLNVPNLGSVFKNPKKGHAGRYVEEAGLKNVRVGQARISEKHGNFIVNEGKASAADVLALIGLVKDKVKEKFQVSLDTEVHVVGEE